MSYRNDETSFFATRGTTPAVVIKINDSDFDMDQIDICRVTIENESGRNKKVFSDCSFDNINKTITFVMSQEDTLAYETGYLLLQVRIKTTNGSVVASPILRLTLGQILDEEIL